MDFPNGHEWRELFIPEEGEKIVAVDFESQEIRYLSVLADIPNMKDFFITGNEIFASDFHAFSATNMFRVVRKDPTLIIQKKTHPKERTISKTLTFGINYGKGSFSTSQELGITEEEAIIFIDGFLDGFPGLRENFEKRKKLAVKQGWIELSPYTKKRYFFPEFEKMKQLAEKASAYQPEDYRQWSKEKRDLWKAEMKISTPEMSALWKEYMILKGKLERRALNFGIQGGCAEMTKIALCLMIAKGLKIINIVHDEFLGTCITEESEKLAEDMKSAMLDSGKRYSQEVPFSGDAAIGDYWIH